MREMPHLSPQSQMTKWGNHLFEVDKMAYLTTALVPRKMYETCFDVHS